MRTSFDEFWRVATGLDSPYAYQRRLAEEQWPEVLIAPTGLGKTAAVVLAWLWRRHCWPEETSRRLVYCLPMRTLVEQTVDAVRKWLTALAAADLVTALPHFKDDVFVLMGGADEGRWYEHPERPAILIGTQDMLVSRALMRGYGMSRFRWPVDFALLHNDAQWIFDEIQLMGAGLATSTQLGAFRSQLGTTLPSFSMWVSATLKPEWLQTVDHPPPPREATLIVPDDVPEDAGDPRVRALLDAQKPLTKAPIEVAGGKTAALREYLNDLTHVVKEVHVAGTRTIVIVNTVARARDLHAALLAAGIPEDRLCLLHSRFRRCDRDRNMAKAALEGQDRVVVTTQAIEAGVDLSSATMITELAPWSSLVQRFGRVNRRGEMNGSGGAPILWVDLPDELAAPYEVDELAAARRRLLELQDAAPSQLGDPGDLAPTLRVIRRRDLIDLFDTDPDLTGFDVDVSPYVRDADDTDVRVFWRMLGDGVSDQPAPDRDELCTVPIGEAKRWLKGLRKHRAYLIDTQARHGARGRRRPEWVPLDGDPWPGLTLMLSTEAGGYSAARGFDPTARGPVQDLRQKDPASTPGSEVLDGDVDSQRRRFISLRHHIEDVTVEAERICRALDSPEGLMQSVVRAARWHDLGKAHTEFQARMDTDDPGLHPRPDGLLAKARRYDRTVGRAYFRHELASMLALLANRGWKRDADLVAYLIAAHHGKVRMSLRALPAEQAPDDGRRFARGIHEGDFLPALDLGGGEAWEGGELTLSIMELGEHPETGASWTERTADLLAEHGPFRLAWAEALLRIGDWRASAAEEGQGDE